jgi:hypothetical protein
VSDSAGFIMAVVGVQPVLQALRLHIEGHFEEPMMDRDGFYQSVGRKNTHCNENPTYVFLFWE